MFRRSLVCVVLACVGAAVPLAALELKAHTLAAWDRYVKLTEDRIRPEVEGKVPFLHVDRKPEAERAKLRTQLAAGKVIVEELQTLDNGKTIDFRDGMVHHWIATVLVPNTPIDRVLQVVQDYDNYSERFSPMIQRSRLVKRSGDEFEVAVRVYAKKMMVSATLDQEFTALFERKSPTRVFVGSLTRRVYEIDNPGSPAETKLDADKGFGWMYRLNTYCSFEERAEGTYEQCESLSLTRALPFLLRWASPIVKDMSKETLETTLGQLRATFVRQ